MNNREYKKLFTINKNIDEKKQTTKNPSPRKVKRILEGKTHRDKNKIILSTLIIIIYIIYFLERKGII